MPAKLMNCVKDVKQSGKDESSAYAICSSKTGWKRSKNNSWKNKKTGETYHESSFDKFFQEEMNKIF